MNSDQEMKDLRRYIAWRRVALPEALHPLLPFLSHYAISDGVDRRELIKQQSSGELRALCQAWESHTAAVEAYFDTQPQDVDRWTEIPFRFLLLGQAYSEARECISRNARTNEAA